VLVERVPWSDGKRPVTIVMMGFLSCWARRLSWRETAQVFGTSWECVYRSMEWLVAWGLPKAVFISGIVTAGRRLKNSIKGWIANRMGLPLLISPLCGETSNILTSPKPHLPE
jgi:predicted DNA-binding transcriptional regulator AlpA